MWGGNNGKTSLQAGRWPDGPVGETLRSVKPEHTASHHAGDGGVTGAAWEQEDTRPLPRADPPHATFPPRDN